MRSRLDPIGKGPDRGPEKALFRVDRDHLGPLHALHQHLDVAVGEFEVLHDIHDRADLEDLVRPRFVHRSVVLRGQKDPPVPGQRLLQRPHAGIPADHEGGHHVWEDDHVPHGHHRQASCLRPFS
jgi:hypothetical protein